MQAYNWPPVQRLAQRNSLTKHNVSRENFSNLTLS